MEVNKMSTLYAGEQTDRRVLPQPSALESVPADNPGVGTKRGTDALSGAAGMQHGRGETREISPDLVSVTPAPDSSGQADRRSDPALTHPRVFVLDKHGRPLMPCHPARARELLAKGRAKVARHTPFVIRLIDRTVEESEIDNAQIGIDPGSKTTGMAVFLESEVDGVIIREAVSLIELTHRGLQISKNLQSRAALRRGRRSRNLRYRAPRFLNRKPATCDSCVKNAKAGKRWCSPCKDLSRAERGSGGRATRLAPSLRHRVEGTISWLNRLSRWTPVSGVHVERVRFDMQKLANHLISGVAYQQGDLQGYEVREYVFEKWGRQCVYCDARNVPLNLDHVLAKANGGSNRASNLVPSCVPCNQDKGKQYVESWLAHDPKRLARIKANLKKPLRDAAAVNSTRFALVRAVEDLGYPTFASSGGRTKWNRHNSHIPKSHALDALCVGNVDIVAGFPRFTHAATSTGRGSYKRTASDRFGFPRLKLTRQKMHHGFVTGDLVRAVAPSGARRGVHVGRVAVRAVPKFNVTTALGPQKDIHAKYFTLIQRADGYNHHRQETLND